MIKKYKIRKTIIKVPTKGIELVIKVRSASLSKGLIPVFGVSDARVTVTAMPEGVEDATSVATGLALEKIHKFLYCQLANPTILL